MPTEKLKRLVGLPALYSANFSSLFPLFQAPILYLIVVNVGRLLTLVNHHIASPAMLGSVSAWSKDKGTTCVPPLPAPREPAGVEPFVV